MMQAYLICEGDPWTKCHDAYQRQQAQLAEWRQAAEARLGPGQAFDLVLNQDGQVDGVRLRAAPLGTAWASSARENVYRPNGRTRVGRELRAELRGSCLDAAGLYQALSGKPAQARLVLRLEQRDGCYLVWTFLPLPVGRLLPPGNR